MDSPSLIHDTSGLVHFMPARCLVPDAWLRVLRQAQKVDPLAMIAGGCIRDLIIHRPVKDIDVIAGQGSVDDFDKAYDIRASSISHMAYAKVSSDLQLILTHMIWGAGEINTIILTAPAVLPFPIDRFDFGVCQAVCDGQDIWVTKAFMEDVDQNRFTLIRCDSLDDLKRSMARYDRLSKKYSGWTMIIPSALQDQIATWKQEAGRFEAILSEDLG